jgi:hypothetical protein
MVVIPPETNKKGGKRTELPYWGDSDSKEVESKLPPDDGSVLYQQKLTYYKQTGVWLPDPWQRPAY